MRLLYGLANWVVPLACRRQGHGRIVIVGCTSSRRHYSNGVTTRAQYEALRKEYDLYNKQLPRTFNFVHDIFDKWAKSPQDGDRLSLWHVSADGATETKLTYKQMAEESRKMASGICQFYNKAAGGQLPRQILVLVSRSGPEWWVTNLAAMRSGSVLYPGSVQLREKDLVFRLKVSQPDCIVAELESAGRIESALASVKDIVPKLKVLVGAHGQTPPQGWVTYEDVLQHGQQNPNLCPHAETLGQNPVQVFFTSGTTSLPKMVPQTHLNYSLGFRVVARLWLGLSPSDLHWNVADTGWAKSAYTSVFAPWMQGCTVFVHAMEKFDAQSVLDTLGKYPITTFCAPPTMYRALLQESNLHTFKSRLRNCVSAGEPMGGDALQRWKNITGLDIREGYGQTESTLIAGNFIGMDIRPGSMGLPAPGYDVYVLNDNGTESNTGEEGHIAVKVEPTWPLGLFRGYMGPEAKNPFTNGFYLTGDKAYRDEDGYLWFVGRSDDIIISSGYRIGPLEVESALGQHPAVAESAVVSSPDQLRGEVVKAFVVLSETYLQANPNFDRESLVKELQAHVKTVTAPYKYPRKVEFCQSLPKTVSGKIRRSQLKSQEWSKVKAD